MRFSTTLILFIITSPFSDWEHTLGKDVNQAIVVRPLIEHPQVSVILFDKQNDQWIKTKFVTKGTIGLRGFAIQDQKREGDFKTSTGIFALGTSFEPNLSFVQSPLKIDGLMILTALSITSGLKTT